MASLVAFADGVLARTSRSWNGALVYRGIAYQIRCNNHKKSIVLKEGMPRNSNAVPGQ